MPCSVWMVLAVRIVAGSCSLLTRSKYTCSEPGSFTSTRKDRCDRCAWTAIQPHLKSHCSQSSLAPSSLWSAHGQGGRNFVSTPSSLTIRVGNLSRTLTPLSLSGLASSASRSIPTTRPVLGNCQWKPNSMTEFDYFQRSTVSNTKH